MTDAKIAQKAPYKVDVVEGKKYAWCTCGLSSKQPFCDGTHKETSLTPIVFTAEETKAVYLCGCKQTGSAPMCDGTHNKI